MRKEYRFHIFGRWGWRSNYRIAKCFLVWLGPSLSFFLPMRDLPVIGIGKREYGFRFAKIGKLALCWWKD